MLPYILIYCTLWCAAIISMQYGQQTRNAIFFAQGTILILFTALKFETGYDWPVYKSNYNGEGIISFELGYKYLANLFRLAGMDFHTFWAILSATIAFGIVYIVKLTSQQDKTVIIAALFAISDTFLIPSFSIVRQAIATLILIIAFFQWRQKNYIGAALLLTLAPFFHVGIILTLIYCIGMAGLLRYKLFAVILFTLGALFYLLAIDIFSLIIQWLVSYILPNFTDYFGKDTFNPRFEYKLVYVIISGFLFFLLYASPRNVFEHAYAHQRTTRAIACAGLLAPLFLFNYPTFHTRLLLFTGFFIAAHTIYSLLRITNVAKSVAVSFIALAMVIPFYRFISSPLSSPFVPYQSIFSFDESNSTGLERTNQLLDLLHLIW